jgi:hypothetical protein
MSQLDTIEARLNTVEQELAELKRTIAQHSQGASWIERIAGTCKDDPDFDEIVRLGREFRKSVP